MSEFAWHIALDRDTAKQLFGHKEPDALQQFVAGLIEDFSQGSAGKILKQPASWSIIESCLQGQLSVAAENSLLSQVFQGGRPLATSEAFSVTLIRPDMVPIVAQQMSDVTEPTLRNEFAGATDGELTEPVDQLLDEWNSTRDFFQQASERRDAIIFTVMSGD